MWRTWKHPEEAIGTAEVLPRLRLVLLVVTDKRALQLFRPQCPVHDLRSWPKVNAKQQLRLKHDYDIFSSIISPNVRINAYCPKCSERIEILDSKLNIGQKAYTTQNIVFA